MDKNAAKKVMRKKLVNITFEMDREIRKRKKETHRTEMQIIQDAVMGRLLFSPETEALIAAEAERQGGSVERAVDMLFRQMASFVQSSSTKR